MCVQSPSCFCGARARLLYLLDEMIGSGASRTQLFRLILVDIAKCNIPSEPFSLELLEKSEALQ